MEVKGEHICTFVVPNVSILVIYTDEHIIHKVGVDIVLKSQEAIA